jgi:hypothetical protein
VSSSDGSTQSPSTCCSRCAIETGEEAGEPAGAGWENVEVVVGSSWSQRLSFIDNPISAATSSRTVIFPLSSPESFPVCHRPPLFMRVPSLTLVWWAYERTELSLRNPVYPISKPI